MTPDGDVAKTLAALGYSAADYPPWFGETYRASLNAVPDRVQGVETVPADAETVEVAEETLYTARAPLAIGQEQPGVYQTPTPTPIPTPRTPAPTLRTLASTPSPPPPSGGRLTPQQMQLLAQQGITYDEGYGQWVKVIP
jgi:hypothetical protein